MELIAICFDNNILNFRKGGMNMKTITDYLESLLQEEIDKLWADGTLNEEKVESFRTLHERTPYHKAKVSC